MFVNDGLKPLSTALPRDKINACRDRDRLEAPQSTAQSRFSLRGQRHKRYEWCVVARFAARKHAAALRFWGVRAKPRASRIASREPRNMRLEWFPLSFAFAWQWHGRLIVIERVILGAFLVLPLLIVAFLFSDELWQEHLRETRSASPRRLDWRHPLRSLLHRH
ncbi:MAG TPA: hypothetical protein VL635_10275 [Trinickia sp.]|nr:hypothetical protein [Trinickia sp.]